jgi:hypothetical protein
MSDAKVRELWSAFEDALNKLSETNPAAARAIMADVSTFETDWWGQNG